MDSVNRKVACNRNVKKPEPDLQALVRDNIGQIKTSSSISTLKKSGLTQDIKISTPIDPVYYMHTDCKSREDETSQYFMAKYFYFLYAIHLFSKFNISMAAGFRSYCI